MIDIELFGRKEIFIPQQEITEETLPKILARAMAIHSTNAAQIHYLWNYYKGKQPILERTKKVRPEICNKLVINHAYEIMNFYMGYVFGDPIQYVQRGIHGAKEGYSDVNNVSMLNELMADDDKASKDRELGEWMLACGVGYRMTMPAVDDDTVFETEILDPRVTFVVKDTGFGKKPWLCVTFNKKMNKGFEYYEMFGYTKDVFFTCEEFNTTFRKYRIVNHVLNRLPITEYPLGTVRLGAFEPVHSIMNAINNVESNRSDGIEQKIQSFLKFLNCDIVPEKFDEFREKGMIKIKVPQGSKGDVEYVEVDLNQTDSQIYVDSLYQKMLQIAGVPDRNASAGGNTGQALIIGQGWSNAEARAKSIELSFKRSEKLFLKMVLRIIQDTLNVDPQLRKLKLWDIDIKFTRNKTDSILVKAQALLNLLEAGVHPRIAFTICGLFNDPEQAYVDSQPYLNAKWLRDLNTNVQEGNIKNENDVLPKLPVTG